MTPSKTSSKKNVFFVFYYRCDSHATKNFTRFHDHVIHELYCHINKFIFLLIVNVFRQIFSQILLLYQNVNN
jgi:uracil DNA glycosylase